jgi:hypothetical protein
MKDLIEEIINILNLPGEQYTDGECLDLIAELLTENGFEVFEEQNESA